VAEAGPLLDQTFKTHPDYLKSKLLLRAAESSLRAARADTGPNLSLVASYNREGKDIPEITNWNAGLVLTVPIFTGGITQAKVDQAKGVLQQNASNSDLVEQNIALAVRSAVLATQDAAERLKTTQKSLEQAREALAVAQEKYAAGLGSTTEVIDTQVALTQAETNYANALYDGKIAAAQLEYAIGKDPAVSEIPGGQNP
jgi:outer membrane protein TolC